MAQTYNLPDAYRGDTYEEIQFTITIDGTPLDLTGATIAMEFRKDSKLGELVKRISIGNGITVVDTVGGVFKIDSFLMTFISGLYYYDIPIQCLRERYRHIYKEL